MKENESLSQYYTKLCDIANESFALGEKIPEAVIMRKIVRSLPYHFQPKIVAIEESKNLDIMKVEDLMSSLRAFEMNMTVRKKEKSIAFKSSQENDRVSNEEEDGDELALLTKI